MHRRTFHPQCTLALICDLRANLRAKGYSHYIPDRPGVGSWPWHHVCGVVDLTRHNAAWEQNCAFVFAFVDANMATVMMCQTLA
jgi:hypothetical protein